jgi:hypothetical protein
MASPEAGKEMISKATAKRRGDYYGDMVRGFEILNFTGVAKHVTAKWERFYSRIEDPEIRRIAKDAYDKAYKEKR